MIYYDTARDAYFLYKAESGVMRIVGYAPGYVVRNFGITPDEYFERPDSRINMPRSANGHSIFGF